jgi:hypothetical protein
MSAFYDQASLVVVPSGYKSGKIYAQKPLTTDGQLTFTRASTATRVNASGLIESVASGVPRLDYTNSSCPKILLEPQRTQSIRNSTMVGAVAGSPGTLPTNWTQGNAIGGFTRTVVGVGVENGLQYVDVRYNGTAISTFGDILLEGVNVTSANAASWTQSVYLKLIAAPNPPIATRFAFRQFNSGGTFLAVTTSSTITTTSSLSRFDRSFTTNQATVAFVQPSLFFDFTNGAAYDFTVRIAAPQMELGSYATSFIPSTTAAVTRLADAASKTGISSLIGQTEGTLFLDANISNLSQARRGILLYADINNYMSIQITGTNLLQFLVVASGAIQANFTIANPQGNVKIALAYKANDFVFYVNGVQRGTDTSGSVPATSELYLGADQTGALQLAGGVNQTLLFKTRLTNAQLAELTTL